MVSKWPQLPTFNLLECHLFQRKYAWRNNRDHSIDHMDYYIYIMYKNNRYFKPWYIQLYFLRFSKMAPRTLKFDWNAKLKFDLLDKRCNIMLPKEYLCFSLASGLSVKEIKGNIPIFLRRWGTYIRWNIIQIWKEWNSAICNNTDGPRDDHTKWS